MTTRLALPQGACNPNKTSFPFVSTPLFLHYTTFYPRLWSAKADNIRSNQVAKLPSCIAKEHSMFPFSWLRLCTTDLSIVSRISQKIPLWRIFVRILDGQLSQGSSMVSMVHASGMDMSWLCTGGVFVLFFFWRGTTGTPILLVQQFWVPPSLRHAHMRNPPRSASAGSRPKLEKKLSQLGAKKLGLQSQGGFYLLKSIFCFRISIPLLVLKGVCHKWTYVYSFRAAEANGTWGCMPHQP